MQNITGLYTALNSLIKSKESEGKICIDKETLVRDVQKEVDVHSASLDWFINMALRAAAEVALYQNGYRSVVKGDGLFVNPEHCNKKDYLIRLFNNAKLTEIQKQKVVEVIKKTVNEKIIPGQLTMDFSTGLLVEDLTVDQILEMLRQDAM